MQPVLQTTFGQHSSQVARLENDVGKLAMCFMQLYTDIFPTDATFWFSDVERDLSNIDRLEIGDCIYKKKVA